MTVRGTYTSATRILIRQHEPRAESFFTLRPIVAPTNILYSVSLPPGCDSCRINLTYINTQLIYPCNNYLTSGPPHPHSNRPTASAHEVLFEAYTHSQSSEARIITRTFLHTMRDLRKQALESHKTLSRKARSKIASGASSTAASRTASRNVSRAPSDDGDDGYLSDDTAWR